MAKELEAKISKNHVVEATIDNFTYKIDWTKRKAVEEREGASPGSVLLTSLAGCNLITAQSFLLRAKVEYSILELSMEAEYEEEEEHTVLNAEITMKTDASLDEEQEVELIKFIDKYCTVSRVLARGNNINLKVQYV